MALLCTRHRAFFFFLVLPLYCCQPISLHPRADTLSHVTSWTAARQAPLSMGFSRQEYWSGLPFPPGTGLLLEHEHRLYQRPSEWLPPTYQALLEASALLQ